MDDVEVSWKANMYLQWLDSFKPHYQRHRYLGGVECQQDSIILLTPQLTDRRLEPPDLRENYI